MFFHNATWKTTTCKISTFFEDLSFLNPRSHLKELAKWNEECHQTKMNKL